MVVVIVLVVVVVVIVVVVVVVVVCHWQSISAKYLCIKLHVETKCRSNMYEYINIPDIV